MSNDLPDVDDVPPGLADLALRAARRAAALHGRRRGDLGTVATKSSATDLATDVDREAERIIVDTILAARPGDAVLAEEGGERTGTSGVRWVVDPLDGTTNYVYGHPPWAVSIAAEVDGRTVAGVVLDPTRGEEHVASLGAGASADGEPLRVGTPPALGRALVATGFSYDPGARAAQAHVLTTVLPRIRDIRRGGSAAVDLTAVARGRVDAYFERGLAPWDVAAGRLIAVEAGAEAVTLADGTVAVAAQPLLGDLVALLTGAAR